MRVNFNFLNGIKLIWVVQMYREKYFSFGKSESVISSRCPASARGAYASSRTWSGMRWTRQWRKTSGTEADGEVVWSWRPDAGAKVRRVTCEMTVAKEPGHRGEHV